VRKGMRMGGHMGACRRTVRDMELVQVNTEKNLLLIRGGVPGPNGGFVIVRQTNKMG
jgi:large subunit ribosomal protein L3